MQREERHKLIKRLLTEQEIKSQEKLLHLLVEENINITQATLSRDLKLLKVGRVPIKDGIRYVIADDFIQKKNINQTPPVSSGFLSISFSGNLGVIRTLPAYAHAVADIIDKSAFPEILGTIAGNDTVLVIIAEDVSRKVLANKISDILPENNNYEN